jgi:hypothetical protein
MKGGWICNKASFAHTCRYPYRLGSEALGTSPDRYDEPGDFQAPTVREGPELAAQQEVQTRTGNIELAVVDAAPAVRWSDEVRGQQQASGGASGIHKCLTSQASALPRRGARMALWQREPSGISAGQRNPRRQPLPDAAIRRPHLPSFNHHRLHLLPNPFDPHLSLSERDAIPESPARPTSPLRHCTARSLRLVGTAPHHTAPQQRRALSETRPSALGSPGRGSSLAPTAAHQRHPDGVEIAGSRSRPRGPRYFSGYIPSAPRPPTP